MFVQVEGFESARGGALGMIIAEGGANSGAAGAVLESQATIQVPAGSMCAFTGDINIHCGVCIADVDAAFEEPAEPDIEANADSNDTEEDEEEDEESEGGQLLDETFEQQQQIWDACVIANEQKRKRRRR